MAGRAVDAIIPVHDSSRPIQRAVESLLRSGLAVPDELRITVVCHNIDPVLIRQRIAEPIRRQVRFLELRDGIPSPAGPFTLGIDESDAEYVTIMGSDDSLDDGALSAWLRRSRELRLGAFIPAERHDTGAKVRTPPVRPFRSGVLDPLRDRLAYRTAPLGLIRRDLVSTHGLAFPTHLANGSDQLFGLKLWFSGERLGYGRGLPAYVVGSDAGSRVTFTVRPAERELAAITDLVADPWFLGRPARVRRAIVAKTVRVHLFSGALVRTSADRWTDEDRAIFRDRVRVFADAAPGYERVLSLADRRLLDALEDGGTSRATLERLLADRRRFGHPVTVLTRDPRGLLAVDGPLRFMIGARLL